MNLVTFHLLHSPLISFCSQNSFNGQCLKLCYLDDFCQILGIWKPIGIGNPFVSSGGPMHLVWRNIGECTVVLATFKNLPAERVQPVPIYCRYIYKRYIFSGPDILPIYCLLTLSRTAFGSKKLSAVMLSVKRLVEDWLLDIFSCPDQLNR